MNNRCRVLSIPFERMQKGVGFPKFSLPLDATFVKWCVISGKTLKIVIHSESYDEVSQVDVYPSVKVNLFPINHIEYANCVRTVSFDLHKITFSYDGYVTELLQYEEKPKEPHKCTCDRLLIMQCGCQCGGV